MGCFSLLFAYSSLLKQRRNSRLNCEIVLEKEHLILSSNLVKYPGHLGRFYDGNYVAIPWEEIVDWQCFNLLSEGATIQEDGAGSVEFRIELRSLPGTYLVIDRMLLLEIEDHLLSAIKKILSNRFGANPLKSKSPLS